jgi:hypothetical protein
MQCPSHGLFRRAHSAAPHPDINLDQHTQFALGGSCGSGKIFGVPRVVHGNGETSAGRSHGECADLLTAADLVGDQHVPDSAPAHFDPFPNRGGADADGARLNLQPRKFHALLHFDMGTQPDVQRSHAVSHEADVPPGHVQVQD